MLNKFLKNLSLLLVLNLIFKPLWVLEIDRHVQNVVGDEQFGLFATLLSFSLLFNTLLDPGLRNYYNTTLAKNHQNLKFRSGQFLSLKILLSLVYGLLLFAVAWLTGDYLEHWKLLAVVGFNQVLLTLLLFFRSTITGLGKYKIDSIMSITDKVVMIGMAVPIFYTQWFPNLRVIETFVYIHSLAYLVSILIALVALRKHLSKIKLGLKFKGLRTVLKITFPFALFTALNTIFFRSDFVMIERLMPDGFLQAGIYRKAFRFLEASSMFALLFGNLLLPVFASMLKKRDELQAMLLSLGKLFLAPAFIFSISCFFFRSEVMEIFNPEAQSAAVDAFGWLMLAFTGTIGFYIYGTALTAMHELKWLNRISALGVLVNVSMNFLLIPSYGISGAVWATVGTQGTVAVFQMLLIYKLCNIKIGVGVMLRVLGFVVVSVALFKASEALQFWWLFKLVVVMALSFTFALVFKLFRPQSLFQLIKK